MARDTSKLVTIPGELHSAAAGNIVAAAEEVFDYTANKYQKDINQEVQSDLDSIETTASGALQKSGGKMTGDIDLDDHALLVRNKNNQPRYGIRFINSGNRQGVYVGNGSMRLIIETSSNSDLWHKYGNNYVDILTAANTKKINGESLYGSGNIAIEDKVFVATYGSTTFAEIQAAVNTGKVVIVKYNNSVYYLQGFEGTVDDQWYEFISCGYDVYIQYVRCITHDQGLTSEWINGTAFSKEIYINQSSTNTDCPTSKAVYDFVQAQISDFITASVDNLTNYYLKSETYTKTEVQSLIGAIQQFHYEIYPALPQSGESNVLYLIGPTGSGNDRYEEYVYANDDFQKIGDTSIDLSGYVTTQALNTALAAKQDTLISGENIKSINGNSILGSGDISIHPEIVNLTDGVNSSSFYENLMRKTDVVKKDTPQIFVYTSYANNISQTAICFSTHDNDGFVQHLSLGSNHNSFRKLSNNTSGGYYVVTTNWTEDYSQSLLNKLKNLPWNVDLQNSLNGKQPTLVSGTNIKTINGESVLGSGNITIGGGSNVFIATYEETPYSEVQEAYLAGKFIVVKKDYRLDTDYSNIFILTDSNYNIDGALGGTYTFTFARNVDNGSAYPKLEGFSLSVDGYSLIDTSYLQSHIDDLSTIRSGAAKGATAYQKPSTGIPASDIAQGVIPDVSNFITRSVNDLTNYYLKDDTYTNTQIDNLIGTIQQFHYEIYASLQDITTPATNVLYLIGPSGSGNDKYEEYVYANNAFVKIGDTSIDLSGYVTTQALNTALANYVTSTDLATLLSGKQDKIDATHKLNADLVDDSNSNNKFVTITFRQF